MISNIIFSLKVKTAETHAFTHLFSELFLMGFQFTYLFHKRFLVFILLLYGFCKNNPRKRTFENLTVLLQELFHPMVHQCTKNVLKVLKIAHQLCHPSFIALYWAIKTVMVNLPREFHLSSRKYSKRFSVLLRWTKSEHYFNS